MPENWNTLKREVLARNILTKLHFDIIINDNDYYVELTDFLVALPTNLRREQSPVLAERLFNADFVNWGVSPEILCAAIFGSLDRNHADAYARRVLETLRVISASARRERRFKDERIGSLLMVFDGLAPSLNPERANALARAFSEDEGLIDLMRIDGAREEYYNRVRGLFRSLSAHLERPALFALIRRILLLPDGASNRVLEEVGRGPVRGLEDRADRWSAILEILSEHLDDEQAMEILKLPTSVGRIHRHFFIILRAELDETFPVRTIVIDV